MGADSHLSGCEKGISRQRQPGCAHTNMSGTPGRLATHKGWRYRDARADACW
jgi:hypothetical protein